MDKLHKTPAEIMNSLVSMYNIPEDKEVRLRNALGFTTSNISSFIYRCGYIVMYDWHISFLNTKVDCYLFKLGYKHYQF